MATFGALGVRVGDDGENSPSRRVLDPHERRRVQRLVDRQARDRQRPSFGPRREAPVAELQRAMKNEVATFRRTVAELGLPWVDVDILERYLVLRATEPRDVAKLNAFLARQVELQQRVRDAMVRRGAVVEIIRTETCFASHWRSAQRNAMRARGGGGAAEADGELAPVTESAAALLEGSAQHPDVPCSDASHRRLCSLLFQHDSRAEELAAALQEWRDGLNRPLPFLMDGANVLFTVRRDVQSVVYPAQLHVMQCRDQPFYYSSVFMTMASSAARRFVAHDFDDEDAAIGRYRMGESQRSESLSQSQSRRKHKGDGGVAVPHSDAFTPPAASRGGQLAFGAQDVKLSARYGDITGGLAVALLRPLPEARDAGKTVVGQERRDSTSYFRQQSVESGELDKTSRRRSNAASLLARRQSTAVGFEGSAREQRSLSLSASITSGSGAMAVRSQRRRSSAWGERRNTIVVGKLNRAASKHFLVADEATTKALEIDEQDIVVSSDEDPDADEVASLQRSASLRASDNSKAPPMARRPTIYTGASPAALHSAGFTGSAAASPALGTSANDKTGETPGSLARNESVLVGFQSSQLPGAVASGSQNPFASSHELPVVRFNAAQLVHREIDVQQAFVQEMLLRCSQGRYVMALKLRGVVSFPPVVQPPASADDAEAAARRKELSRPVAQRALTPSLKQHGTPAPGSRPVTVTPGPGIVPRHNEDASVPVQLPPLPGAAGRLPASALNRPLSRAAPGSGARQLPRRRDGSAPLMGPVTTANVNDHHRAAKGLSPARTGTPSLSLTRRAAFEPAKLYAPVDEGGVTCLVEPESLDWITQCYTHAKRRLDTFARHVAMGEHAFTMMVAQHNGGGGADASSGLGLSSDGADEEAAEDARLDVENFRESFLAISDRFDGLDAADDGERSPSSQSRSLTSPNGGSGVRRKSDAREREKAREREAARLMAFARKQQLRMSYFQMWLRRTMRVREIRRLAGQLGVHTGLCSLYVCARAWRNVVERRKVLRKRSELLLFSLQTHRRREVLHWWRTVALLAAITRTINRKLYLDAFNALRARVSVRRAAAGNVAALAIDGALSQRNSRADDGALEPHDAPYLRLVGAMGHNVHCRSLGAIVDALPNLLADRAGGPPYGTQDADDQTM